MRPPKKNIRFAIDTVEDLQWNNEFDEFFIYLGTLIHSGFTIEFHRIDNNKLTKISDLPHLRNFKSNFDFPRE